MKKFIYNKRNFFKNTYCVFTAVDSTQIDDMLPDYISKSGSKYYYTEKGVFRVSTHWGRAATCKWRLQTASASFRNGIQTGFAEWSQFYKDNEVEKLYFIQQNATTKKFEYYHKEAPRYTDDFVLRTSGETRKVLRQLKMITTETKWANYVPHDDIEALRRFIIDGLITTDTSFQELKRIYVEFN